MTSIIKVDSFNGKVLRPFTASIPSALAGSSGAVGTNASIPSGYQAIGVIVWTTAGVNQFPVWGDVHNHTAVVRYYNARTSASTNSVAGYVICEKI